MNETDSTLTRRGSLPSVVGGYRIIRALGAGSRSTVWLGHSDLHAEFPAVALKLFAKADADSIAAETRAYDSVESQHVVRLLDVCTAPDASVCFVLERLGGGSLAAFVRQRRRIRAGEAVTVLVSVLRGIRDLHAAGLAHNAVVPTNVLFDQSGRPVLIALGRTTPLPPVYSDTAAQARGAEWSQFIGLVDLVLERVESDGREAEVKGIRRTLEQLVTTADERSSCDRVEDAMYAFAQPAPLVLHPTSIPGSTHRSEATEERAEPAPRRAMGHSVGTELAARAEALLEAGPVQSLKAIVAPGLRRRRKQVVFGAVLAGVVGVVGLAAIPPGTGSASTPGQSKHAGHTTQVASSRARPAAKPSPIATGSPPASSDLITQDEPVGATVALLETRARCVAKRSRACLKLADQDASPLLAADTAALQQGSSLADISSANASLIERTGNSALVDLPQPGDADQPAAEPVSALVIKGQSGWRLREIFAG